MSFWKRVWESRKKIFIYGGGALTTLLIFLAGLSRYGVSIESSGDIVCAGTAEQPCISYFNITLRDYTLCFGSSFKGVTFDDDEKLQSWQLWKTIEQESGRQYCTYGRTYLEWEHIGDDLYYCPSASKQNKVETQYQRCDKLSSTGKMCYRTGGRIKLPYEFSAGSCMAAGQTHEFILVGYKDNPYETVKWGVGYGAAIEDPYWYGLPVGLEYFSATDVFHLWNTKDDYFIDAGGLQLTNHYEDYWTKNVFCLWIKIPSGWEQRCTDGLVWNWVNNTDNTTFIELNGTTTTTEGSYEIITRIRYYLEYNSDYINVSVGIKNTGLAMGDVYFGWITKDIGIMGVDGDSLYLNESGTPVMLELSTASMAYTQDDLVDRKFTIRDDDYKLYIDFLWDEHGWKNDVEYNMPYMLNITKDILPGQYNSPIGLILHVGQMNNQDTAYTNFWWRDPTNMTLFFDAVDWQGDISNGPWDSYDVGDGSIDATTANPHGGNAAIEFEEHDAPTDYIEQCVSGVGYDEVYIDYWWAGDNLESGEYIKLDIDGVTVDTLYGGVLADNEYEFNSTSVTANGGTIDENICFRFICLAAGPVDECFLDDVYIYGRAPRPPTYSNYEINETDVFEGYAVNHSVDIAGNSGGTPNGYRFSWNATNGCADGTWENGSYVETNTEDAWNATTIPIGCAGKVIGWKFYADNADGETVSDQYNYSVYKYGNIAVNWTYGAGAGLNDSTCTSGSMCEYDQNETFTANATVECVGGSGAKCGTVSGAIRVNLTSVSEPDYPINTTEDDEPMFIEESDSTGGDQISCSNLTNIDDTYVNEFSGDEDDNYGNGGAMWLRTWSSGDMRLWSKFDTAFNNTPINYIINATFNAYYYDQYNDPVGRTYNLYNTSDRYLNVDTPWEEGDGGMCGANCYELTWNNQTSTDTLQGSDTVPAAYGWMSWSIGEAINSSFNNNKNLSITIQDSSEGSSTQYRSVFYAKESAGIYIPYLTICYNETSTVPDNPVSLGNMDNGDTYQLNFTVNVSTSSEEHHLIDFNFSSSYGNSLVPDNTTTDAYVHLNPSEDEEPSYTTITLQTANTEILEDGEVWENNWDYHPDGDYFLCGILSRDIGGTPYNRRCQWKFNMTALTENGVTWENLHSAELQLFLDSSTQSEPKRNYTAWNASNLTWNEDTVTWRLRPRINGTVLDNVSVDISSVDYWVNWTVTDAIRLYLKHGITNGTIIIIDDAENNTADQRADFGSKEHAITSRRPKLVVEFLDTGYQNISACQILNVANRIYNLTQSITESSTDPCFEVIADNVTLECNGYTIDGTTDSSGYAAIQIKSNNFTAKNCVIEDYYRGVWFDTPSNASTLEDSNIGDSTFGVVVSSSYNTIQRINTTEEAAYSIWIDADNNSVYFSNISAVYYGISMVDTYGNFVNNTTFYQTGRMPVHVRITDGDPKSCNNTVSYSNSSTQKPILYYNNTQVTIGDFDNNITEVLLCDADNSIVDNVSFNPTVRSGQGIIIINSEGVNLTNIDANNTFWTVLVDYFSLNTTIINVTVNNSADGIRIARSNFTKVRNATIQNADSYGVYISVYSFWSEFYNLTTDSSGFDNILIQDSNLTTFVNITTSNSIWKGINIQNSNQTTINYSRIVHNNYGIAIDDSQNTTIQNSLFNSTTSNILFVGVTYRNLYNSTNVTGTRIFSSGTNIGGNYWDDDDLAGGGFSKTCTDSDSDGFCDDFYDVENNDNDCSGVQNCDYLPLSDEYEAAGAPDINETFGPPETLRFVWDENDTGHGCGPDNTSFLVEPKNQSSDGAPATDVGIIKYCNSGDASGDAKLALSGTANTGWVIMASIDNSSSTSNLLELSTTPQIIKSSMTADTCLYTYMFANCTTIDTNPGVSLVFSISA